MKGTLNIHLLAITLLLIGSIQQSHGSNDLDSLKQEQIAATDPAKRAKTLLAIADEYGREPDSLLLYSTMALAEARNSDDSILMFRMAAKELYAHTYFDNSEQIVSIGEEFLPIAAQVEDTLLRIGFLNILGGFGYFPMGNILEHLHLQEQALSLIESSPNYIREASFMAYNLYQGYYSIGKPKEATVWIEKIHKRAEQFQDSSALIQMYILLGQTTDYIQREQGPVAYFSKAYRMAEQIKDTAALGEAASFLGQAYERSGDLDSAIFFLNKSIFIEQTLGNRNNEMFSRFVLGKFYSSSDKYELAWKEIRAAKDFFTRSENRIQLVDIDTEMGLILIGLGKKAEGIQLLTQTIDSARHYEYQKGIIQSYTNLAVGYEMVGELKKAITAKDSLLIFQREAFKIQQDEITEQIAIQTESQQQELENTRLRLNNLNLKANNRKRLNILVLSIMMVLIIGIVSIFLRNKWRTERIHRIELDKKINDQTQHLSDSIEKLTEANEDLRKFTFLASHNFKTSIRTVKSIADLLKIKIAGKAPENLNYLDLIGKAGIDMNNTLDSLTAFFDLRESEVHLSPVDLASLCPIVAEEVSQLYPKKQAKISCNGLGIINGNEEELILMARHLLDNAMTYHSPDQKPEINISGKENAAGFEFRISDNGLGINPKYQEQIFEAFTRLHSSDSYEGVGIGLAIIKRVVDRHQATIRVESTLGEGSSFIIQFPKFPDSPQR